MSQPEVGQASSLACAQQDIGGVCVLLAGWCAVCTPCAQQLHAAQVQVAMETAHVQGRAADQVC